MATIKEQLMHRDGISAKEAEEKIATAKMDLFNRLEDGEDPFDICEEHFGLETGDHFEELFD